MKYVQVKDKIILAILTSKGCQLYNPNGTRQLAYIDSKKKLSEGKVNFFTSAATGYEKGSSDEFIAVGTSSGEIYSVTPNGSSFVKEIAFQMTDQSAITCISGDPKSKNLAVGNSNGYVIIFETDNQAEWKPISNIGPKDEIPVTALQTLNRSGLSSLFIAGFANGMVKVIHATVGSVLAEIGAHSRGLNALTVHPTKPIFASCGDDTFLNVFQVTSDNDDSVDVSVNLSSKVNDFQLVGVAFGGDNSNSIVATPYDFKNLIIWNNVL